MNLLKLTHANTGDVGYVLKELIFTFHPNSADGSTHVMSNAGAIFPAKEEVEYFIKHLNKEDTKNE